MEGVEGDDRPFVRRKKHTRRWCRGKEGVEHDFKRIGWHERPNYTSFGDPVPGDYLSHWKIDRCENCGKQVWVSDD